MSLLFRNLAILLKKDSLLLFISSLFIASFPFFIGEIISQSLAFRHGSYINYFQVRITLHFVLSVILIIIGLIRIFNVGSHFDLKKIPSYFWGISLTFFTLLAWNIYLSSSAPEFILLSSFHLVEFLLSLVALFISISSLNIVSAYTKRLPSITKGMLLPVITFQVALQSLQMVNSAPVFGSFLKLLGQPIVFESITQIGIDTFARGYGTTPHPNILACIYLFFLALLFGQKRVSIIDSLILVLISIGVFLTLSRIGIIVLIIFIIIKLIRHYLPKEPTLSFKRGLESVVSFLCFSIIATPLLLLLQNNLPYFISSRMRLLESYSSLFHIMPSGTGFSLSIEKSITAGLTPIWGGHLLLEPVHNIGLLLLTEIGIIGSILVILFVYLLARKTQIDRSRYWIYFLVLVSLFGAFDHFLLY